MAADKGPTPLQQLRNVIAGQQTRDVSDQELLTRFLRQRDEAAFAALMERHGRMVLGVCRRVLRDRQDGEDACQAAFLVLARRAGTVRKQGSLASWLHGVAWRVARRLRSSNARRLVREGASAARRPSASDPEDVSLRDVLRVLDEELNRLPARYRGALVLCHLEGLTQDEACSRLGCTRGALRGWLERGRQQLRRRLLRRGVTASAALAVGALAPSVCSAALPPTLVVTTVNASARLAAGQATTLPPRVLALTEAVLREMALAKLVGLAAMAGTIALLAALALTTLLDGKVPETVSAATARAESWSEVARLQGPDGMHAWHAAFSPDGARLAVGSGGTIPHAGALTVWDVATGQVAFQVDTPRSVRCVAFAPDGTTLATAEHDSAVRVRAADTGAALFTLRGHRSNGDCVCFFPDGQRLATSSWDGTVKLWQAADGQELASIVGSKGQVFAVVCNPAADTLVFGGDDGTATIHDLVRGRSRFTLRGHQGVIHWLALSPDGKTLASASWDRTVRLWDIATGKSIATLQGHVAEVLAVAFAPDGRTLASCSGSWGNATNDPELPSPGEVILWDLVGHQALARLRHKDRVFGVTFSPDGQTLATACWDGAVTLWQRGPAAQPEPLTASGPAPQFVMTQEDGAPPRREYALDYHPPLPGAVAINGLRIYGPEAQECVKFEAEGLRITLPVGYPRPRPGTGVVTEFGVHGDFEATLSYEILADAPPGAAPAAMRLVAVPMESPRPELWYKSSQNRAVVAREGDQLIAQATRWNNEDIPRDKWGNEIFNDVETSDTQHLPASARTGRLRLVRSGSALYFLASDGGARDFTLLQKHDFTSKDLRNMRLLASTGGLKSSFDVRVTDLHIRAEGLPQEAEAGPAVAVPAAPRRRWLLPVTMAGLAALGLLATALLLRRPHRRRTHTGDVAAIVLAMTLPALLAGCRDRPVAPVDEPALTADQQILLALDYYEPVYKVDASGRVQRLRLGGRHLPPSVLAEINKLTELVALALEWSTITDDGLGQLKDLQALRSMGLSGTAITDRGLAHLEKLHSLQHVWVPRQSISAEAVEQLKQTRPDLHVYRQ